MIKALLWENGYAAGKVFCLSKDIYYMREILQISIAFEPALKNSFFFKRIEHALNVPLYEIPDEEYRSDVLRRSASRKLKGARLQR